MNHLGRRCRLGLCALALLVYARTASAQAVRDELQEKVNQAIDRGVKYLKASQNPKAGYWGQHNDFNAPGVTALVGWALLESGVPAADPVIQKAAAFLRASAVSEKRCYNLALGIFFFDKLGDPEDIPLIESLALRLMEAQTSDGGWTYVAPNNIPEANRVHAAQANAGRRGGAAPVKLPRTWAQLDPAVQRECVRIAGAQAQNKLRGGDNSNTQFAMIALWVTRKYGLPVQPYLARTGQRFVHSQQQNGSWEYMQVIPQDAERGKSSPAMTCAGLLGLWLNAANEPRADLKRVNGRLLKQNNVQAGFAYLAHVMCTMRQADANHYYILWSLERVGMGYDSKLIGGVNWYQWAAEWLVRFQRKDGCWANGKYGACDSAFALLVLRRVNVLKLPPPGELVNDVAIAKDKKERPRTRPKEDLPPPDLAPPRLVPPDESPKPREGGKTKSSGAGRSSVPSAMMGRPSPAETVQAFARPSARFGIRRLAARKAL